MATGQSDSARAEAHLRFDGVTCRRGGRLLFERLSLTLKPGETLHIAGPNGTGKSSLLRMAAGLLAPVGGTVTRSVAAALTDDKAAIDGDRSVLEALQFWAAIDGVSMDGIVSALQNLGCAHLADIPVRLLSTGQRKRVALARTIAADAPLWLLDEPANGLDSGAVPLLERAMTRHCAAGGSVMIASHIALDLNLARQIDLGAEVAV